MILKTFSALSHTNLNNGTTTIAITHDVPHTPARVARVEIVGGYFNRYAGTQAPRLPRRSLYTARYKYKGTHAALMGHINTLETVDKGKTGLCTWDGEDGNDYTATAVLNDVSFTQRFPGNGEAVISLALEILTPIEEA